MVDSLICFRFREDISDIPSLENSLLSSNEKASVIMETFVIGVMGNKNNF
ncbi:hypothetical protein J8J42_02560 [Chryseobacterium sp. cx-311]|nr:hypothetical protein [Marnyiella aurantia]MBP0611926.1 hypothetical protein [Marnyiella aurantia]